MNWISNLRYKLFNINPSSIANPIFSSNGKKYWIVVEDKHPKQIFISRKSRYCGHMNLLWRDDLIELWDIILLPKYRGNGLGTSVLQWLIDYARKEKIKRIWGVVTPENEMNFDRLMGWYIRQGFRKISKDGKQIIIDLQTQ